MEVKFESRLGELLARLLVDLPASFCCAVAIDWLDGGHRLDDRRLRIRFPPRREAPRLPFDYF